MTPRARKAAKTRSAIEGGGAESDCIVTPAQTELAPAAPVTVLDHARQSLAWLTTDLPIGLMLGGVFGAAAGLQAGEPLAGTVGGIAVGTILALLVRMTAPRRTGGARQ